MVFMLFYLDFWEEIVHRTTSDLGERLFMLFFAVVAVALFPISLPIIFMILNLKDIVDEREINIYGLSKKEILKEQAKVWFLHKFYEYWLANVLDNIRWTITVGMLYISAPIMFPVIYIFFISTQKHFAKKEIIKALRA